jgi:hypothetical protein
MSSSDEELFTEVDISLVEDCFREPSYISEVARKMRDANMPLGYSVEQLDELETLSRTWNDITENHSVRLAAFIANFLTDDGEGDFIKEPVEYDVEEDADYGESQVIGSVKTAMGPEGGVEQKEWRDYQIVHKQGNIDSEVGSPLRETGWHELATRLEEKINPSMSREAKRDMIKSLSRAGNKSAMNTEKIAKDVFERQFKYYDEVGWSEFNQPGPDFYVVDENQREHGLVLEVSSRFVNAIGDPYITTKIDKIVDMEGKDDFEDVPYDLAILAPRFSKRSEDRYEDPGSPEWHKTPTSEMVHLHRVPNPEETLYRHFLQEDIRQAGDIEGGNPIVVPDIERVKERLVSGNQVGKDYPVVDEDFSDFEDSLQYVNREYDVISESRYRNMLRESIEPLLWEFARPYKIEQFLIDTYWDKSLTQSEIGNLVHRSESTIGEWMRAGLDANRWDVVRRGTGAPEVGEETIEIWKKMYRGEEPFPEPYSGYRILAEYNRFPFWGLDDWREWHREMSEKERMDFMRSQDSYRDELSYTVLVGAGENRFQPSYTFILDTLRENGVEIRAPDEAPQAPYASYSNSKTVEWMINRDVGLVGSDTEGRSLPKQEDVEVFDSYLEVDISTWLSENDIAHAHEPFTIPSLYGPGRDQWERMVQGIRAVGKSATSRTEAQEMFSNIKEEAESSDSTNRIDNLIVENNFNEFVGRILPIWNEIYGKHDLGSEDISPDPLPALEFFDKRYVIPDVVVYRGEEKTKRGINWEDWDNWSHILEVSGLWGINVPPEADNDQWWDWYRVSGVAFKELAYRLLGLWEKEDGSPRVIYIVPDQAEIAGVTDGIPQGLRQDDNYVIFNSTATDLGMEELKVELGITAGVLDSGLSPPIELISYERPSDTAEINPVEYDYDGIDIEQALGSQDIYLPDDETIVYWGGLGEVYITDDSVHVKESMWLRQNMIMIREYVTDVMSKLSERGIVQGMRRVV